MFLNQFVIHSFGRLDEIRLILIMQETCFQDAFVQETQLYCANVASGAAWIEIEVCVQWEIVSRKNV